MPVSCSNYVASLLHDCVHITQYREMNAKETPVSYSKLEFEHEDTETIPPIAEPLPEKPTT